MFFCLYGLGNAPIHDWDEARNGLNALEMMRNKNWFYLTYNGALDNWNAKPPGFIWLIVFGYEMFGPSTFGLRFFSAVSAWLCALYVYRLSLIWCGQVVAIFVAASLLCSKALLGVHTGRTGDFDTPLMASMTACAFYFLTAIRSDSKDNRATYFKFSVAYIIGVLIKGPAILQIVLGLILCESVYRNNTRKFLFTFRTYIYGLLAALPIGIWLVIKHFVELPLAKEFNSVSLATVYDVWTRFTTAIEGHGAQGLWEQLTWVPSALDILFTPWIYLLYALGTFILVRRKLCYFNTQQKDGLIFCVSLFAPLGLLLTFSQSRLLWYAAPLAVSCAIALGILIDSLVGTLAAKNGLKVNSLCFVVLLVTFGLQLKKFSSAPLDLFVQNLLTNKDAIRAANRVCVAGTLSQSQRLNLNFLNSNVAEGLTDYSAMNVNTF